MIKYALEIEVRTYNEFVRIYNFLFKKNYKFMEKDYKKIIEILIQDYINSNLPVYIIIFTEKKVCFSGYETKVLDSFGEHDISTNVFRLKSNRIKTI